MRVDIRARQFSLTDALRDHVEKRLETAVGHQKEHIADVTVQLSDENGPKGGDDKLAHITAMVLGKAVVIDERNANMYAAIDGAMDRLGEGVRRAVDKKREFTT